MDGAGYIARFLEQHGPPVIFGVPGHSTSALYDALQDVSPPRVVIARHEEGAAFMADGFARLSTELGVVCASSGPGSTNLASGLLVAGADSTPLLVFTGQVPRERAGGVAFQEVGSRTGANITDVLRPLVKYTAQAANPAHLARLVPLAATIAKAGRPGPAHISIPVDLLKEEVPGEPRAPGVDGKMLPCAPPEAVEEAAELLTQSDDVVLIAGRGVVLSRAWKELQALAEHLGSPVVTTPQGRAAVPADHPLNAGHIGYSYAPRARALFDGERGTVLAVGTGLGHMATIGFEAALDKVVSLIHCDVDGGEIGRNFPTRLGLVGDAKAVLGDLLAAIRARSPEPMYKRSAEALSRLREALPPYPEPEKTESTAEPLLPQRAIAELNAALPPEGVVFGDSGENLAWLIQYFRPRTPTGYQVSLNMACMGWGVAAPIGAKLAVPERPVVAVTGDGCFMMNGLELATAVTDDVPVIWIVLNNGGYGFTEHSHKQQFERGLPKAFAPVDYVGLARSLGAVGTRITRPGELAARLPDFIASERPTVVDVAIDPNEIIPPIRSVTWGE